MQEIKSNCYPLTKNCRLVTLAWCTKSMFRIGIFGNLAIRINVANIANMDIPENIYTLQMDSGNINCKNKLPEQSQFSLKLSNY